MDFSHWLDSNKDSLEAIGAIVGSIGGILGFVSFMFTVKNYRKTHIYDPNKLLLKKCIPLSWSECFNSHEPNLLNNHDFEKIYALTHHIISFKVNGNRFKGITPRWKFSQVLSSAQNLNATFEHFTGWAFLHGSESENALTEYRKREKEIKDLDKKFKEFYRITNGYISNVDSSGTELE